MPSSLIRRSIYIKLVISRKKLGCWRINVYRNLKASYNWIIIRILKGNWTKDNRTFEPKNLNLKMVLKNSSSGKNNWMSFIENSNWRNNISDNRTKSCWSSSQSLKKRKLISIKLWLKNPKNNIRGIIRWSIPIIVIFHRNIKLNILEIIMNQLITNMRDPIGIRNQVKIDRFSMI